MPETEEVPELDVVDVEASLPTMSGREIIARIEAGLDVEVVVSGTWERLVEHPGHYKAGAFRSLEDLLFVARPVEAIRYVPTPVDSLEIVAGETTCLVNDRECVIFRRVLQEELGHSIVTLYFRVIEKIERGREFSQTYNGADATVSIREIGAGD